MRLGSRGVSDSFGSFENDEEKAPKEQQQPNIVSTYNNVEDNITLEAVLVNDEDEGQSNIEQERQRLEQQIRDEFLRTVVTGEVTPVTPNKKLGKFSILAVVLQYLLALLVLALVSQWEREMNLVPYGPL